MSAVRRETIEPFRGVTSSLAAIFGMKILLTTWSLSDNTGAELHTRDMALALHRRGHDVTVYAANRGPLSERLAADGVRVTDDLRAIGAAPDIIHAHHQPALLDALIALPHTPAVYVIHDATSALDAPFAFRRVRRHVAVDRRCLGRIQDAGIAGDEQATLLNFVDLDRFQPRGPLPAHARRALVFSNYAAESNHLAAIRQACAQAGLELDVVGKGVGRPLAAPEAVLGQYDVVFAKARAAIEAMAVGAAVILCDFAGLGEMVTAAEFDRLREWNFGAGVLGRPTTVAGILGELRRYDRADAATVSGRIRAEAGLDQAVDGWLALYAQVLEETTPPDRVEDRALLLGARRGWAGLRRVDRIRARTRRLRASIAYRVARAIWRAIGSPGARPG